MRRFFASDCPRTYPRARVKGFGCTDVKLLIDRSAARTSREIPSLTAMLPRATRASAGALDKLVGQQIIKEPDPRQSFARTPRTDRADERTNGRESFLRLKPSTGRTLTPATHEATNGDFASSGERHRDGVERHASIGDRCHVPGNVSGPSRRVSPMPAGEGENACGSSPQIAAPAIVQHGPRRAGPISGAKRCSSTDSTRPRRESRGRTVARRNLPASEPTRAIVAGRGVFLGGSPCR